MRAKLYAIFTFLVISNACLAGLSPILDEIKKEAEIIRNTKNDDIYEPAQKRLAEILSSLAEKLSTREELIEYFKFSHGEYYDITKRVMFFIGSGYLYQHMNFLTKLFLSSKSTVELKEVIKLFSDLDSNMYFYLEKIESLETFHGHVYQNSSFWPKFKNLSKTYGFSDTYSKLRANTLIYHFDHYFYLEEPPSETLGMRVGNPRWDYYIRLGDEFINESNYSHNGIQLNKKGRFYRLIQDKLESRNKTRWSDSPYYSPLFVKVMEYFIGKHVDEFESFSEYYQFYQIMHNTKDGKDWVYNEYLLKALYHVQNIEDLDKLLSFFDQHKGMSSIYHKLYTVTLVRGDVSIWKHLETTAVGNSEFHKKINQLRLLTAEFGIEHDIRRSNEYQELTRQEKQIAQDLPRSENIFDGIKQYMPSSNNLEKDTLSSLLKWCSGN